MVRSPSRNMRTGHSRATARLGGNERPASPRARAMPNTRWAVRPRADAPRRSYAARPRSPPRRRERSATSRRRPRRAPAAAGSAGRASASRGRSPPPAAQTQPQEVALGHGELGREVGDAASPYRARQATAASAIGRRRARDAARDRLASSARPVRRPVEAAARRESAPRVPRCPRWRDGCRAARRPGRRRAPPGMTGAHGERPATGPVAGGPGRVSMGAPPDLCALSMVDARSMMCWGGPRRGRCHGCPQSHAGPAVFWD